MWFFYTTKTLDADKLAYHLPNSFLLFFSSRTRLCFALEISHLYTRWIAWIRHQLLCLWRFIYLCISHTLNRSLIDERNKTIKKTVNEFFMDLIWSIKYFEIFLSHHQNYDDSQELSNINLSKLGKLTIYYVSRAVNFTTEFYNSNFNCHLASSDCLLWNSDHNVILKRCEFSWITRWIFQTDFYSCRSQSQISNAEYFENLQENDKESKNSFRDIESAEKTKP